MSRTECHSGIITKSCLSSKECKNLVQRYHPDRTEPLWDSWEADLVDEFWHKYVLLNGVLYCIEDKEIDEDNTFLTKMGQDTYKYVSTFYNGSTCLSEELENALNELNDEEV